MILGDDLCGWVAPPCGYCLKASMTVPGIVVLRDAGISFEGKVSIQLLL